MSDPYWIKNSGSGYGPPYYNSAPPPHQQPHQMSQHQVPPQQIPHQIPQQIRQQPQHYQNMSWNEGPPKPSADSWGSWQNQPQGTGAPINNPSQNYSAYNYAQQPLHQSSQPQSADSWNWGVDEAPQANLHQQPQLNNNLDQSFHNDSSWNWSVDPSAATHNSVDYYQMGYGNQQGYTDPTGNTQNQFPANNNSEYTDTDLVQAAPQNIQGVSTVTQFDESSKGEEAFKTEQPVEVSERYEDHPEPAMSEASKNSMTPQWSIESQMSQDSDDISSSIGQPGGVSPASTSQAKSEGSGHRAYGYGGTGDGQNLWEDTEDDEDLNDRNCFLEQGQESTLSVPEVDRHSQLNLDETISALESLNMTSENSNVAAQDQQPPPSAPSSQTDFQSPLMGHTPDGNVSFPSSSVPPSGSHLSGVAPPSMGPLPGAPPSVSQSSGGPPLGVASPSPSAGPPVGIAPGGPPSVMPPSANQGLPASGNNPYSVSRGGLTHKSASKLFPGAGMSRHAFPTPLQSSSGSENIEASSTQQPSSQIHDIQPSFVEGRSHEPPVGQESHDTPARFGLDRNQYLETGQLTSQASEEESAPPPGLHRLVTGQLTEQDSQAEVSTPPPGLDRMIPGQITEEEGLRMVPGRMTAEDDDDDDDNDASLRGMPRNALRGSSRDQNSEHTSNLRRMIPGQTDSQEEEDELPNICIGPGDLPPGLHRMVPGESSSPESQAPGAGSMQSSQINSAFQPIEPREPRVVTGVSMESMPQPVPATPPQQPIKVEPVSPSPDVPHEGRGPGTAQPPSERSETIGSDGVDEKATDNTVKKSDRRSRDDTDSEAGDSRGRDFYRGGRDRDGDRERSLSPSDSGGNRHGYRDDRDRRYDPRLRGDRDRERDRRSRDKEADYDSDRRQPDSRRDPRSAKREKSRRGYNREDDEGDSDEYASDRDSRKWNRDRDLDRDMDRDRNRDADRDRDRDRDRERYRERDRYRDRDAYRDRDEYYRRGERRGRDEPDKGRRSGGRRSDDYHRGYDDDYYRDRRSSRPSSRSGSVHEYGHGYERDYRDERQDRPGERHPKHNQYYPGYYYNPQDYYRYQMYYANLRKTDPEAYAAWYRKYYSQYAASQPGTYEDRGSVHSGRSSANEELNNQRFERQRSPNRSQTSYQKSPQASSLNRYQSIDNASALSHESGRGVGHGESSLDETNSSIQRLTPFKFSTAHVKGILTRRGHLLKVLSHYPLDGQSAAVEVHSMQSLMPQDPNIQELLVLPGPLVKGVTHKKTIMMYLRSKMESTRTDPTIFDRQSVILLYELLILLLRQNGMIVGTDIAELLLRNGENSDGDDSLSASGIDHRAQSTPSPAPSAGSRTSSASATGVASVMNSSSVQQTKLSESEITNKFREFLLYGSTKEALEWAMKHGLWGHALFLSSKLDQRMYHSVMTRFANGLALTDPIQTLYQLLSGWQPAAVTCVADDRWGDWRPHLAMILSNTSSRPEVDHKAIMTLGDTLGARGCLHAAHFCYLMAQHPFGTYAQRSSKYVLLGSSHLRAFAEFASTEAIMITCIYEYARSLADPNFHIPNLQPYKYLMATRLVEANLLPEAVHYCEVVARLIVQNPQQYEASFIHDVAELGESLKFHDPFYSSGGDLVSQGDPDWLLQIRPLSSDSNAAVMQPNSYTYGDTYSSQPYNMTQSDALHEQSSMSSLSLDPAPSYSQEMSQSYIPTEQQQQDQQVQQQQPLPQLQSQTDQLQQQSYYYQDQQPWSVQEGQQQQQMVDPATYNSEGYGQVDADQSGWWSNQEEVSSIPPDTNSSVLSGPSNMEQLQQQQTIPAKPTPSIPPLQATGQPQTVSPASTKTANRQPAASSGTQSNSSWFGGLWNKLALRPKNQMKLPDDKNPSIVWDDQKKRWVNTDADGEEENSNLAPPPKMSEMPGRFASPGPLNSTTIPPSSTPVVANGSAGMPISTPHVAAIPAVDNKENSPVAIPPPAGPNMFKLPRGRSLRASYVDVMNPSGTKAAAPAPMPPSNPFPTSLNNQQSAPNYFVPATVEGNENAPTDFLTPAPAPIVPAEPAVNQAPLSRWSSTSSLSREVQSYTSGRPPSRNQMQPAAAGPQMFNPAQFSQQPMTTAANRKRYAN